MIRPEQALHRQVAQYLNLALPDDVWWTTFPSGGGGLMRGKILNSVGLKPGVPDILIIDGCCLWPLWIELKAPKGRLSEAQRDTHNALHKAGCYVAVCRSLDEVVAFLEFHGVPLKAKAV